MNDKQTASKFCFQDVIIDPSGVVLPDKDVPMTIGFDKEVVVGMATGFAVEDGEIRANFECDIASGLSPAISGNIVESRERGGVLIVEKFYLRSVGWASIRSG